MPGGAGGQSQRPEQPLGSAPRENDQRLLQTVAVLKVLRAQAVQVWAGLKVWAYFREKHLKIPWDAWENARGRLV